MKVATRGPAEDAAMTPRYDTARLGAGGPVSRRQPRLRLRQWQRVETQTACHTIDRDDMRYDTNRLNILLFPETGPDNAAKPLLTETAGVGTDPMHNFDHDFRQSAEVVVLTLDRYR